MEHFYYETYILNHCGGVGGAFFFGFSKIIQEEVEKFALHFPELSSLLDVVHLSPHAGLV